MLKGKIARGAAWMLLFRVLDRSLGLISTFILARLLLPADFGVVAMAMSVIALIELASAFSLDVPLIQRPELTRAHYDTAWTFNLMFASGCGMATAALAYPTAAFYDEPRLATVMFVLGAGWCLQGLENIGIVNFRRTMQFHRETAFLLGRRFSGFIVGVGCAIWLRSYWALVAGMLTTRLTGVALSYLMEPYRPRFSLRARADLFAISVWLLLNNILQFAMMRVSHFIIGRFYDARILGLYSVGAELAYMPQTQLIAPVNRAVFPGYSRMVANPGEMRSGFIDINAFIGALALPAGIGIAVLAEPIVHVLLGENWLDAVPVMQILAFSGAASALMSNTYSAYLALGRPYIPTILLLVEVLVLVPGLILLPGRFGVNGVAYAELLAVMMGTLCSYPMLFRTLKISSLAYISNLWRPALAAVAMGAAVATLVNGPYEPLSPIAELLAGVATGVVLYGVVLFGLWYISGRPRGAEHTLIGLIASRIHRPLHPASET